MQSLQERISERKREQRRRRRTFRDNDGRDEAAAAEYVPLDWSDFPSVHQHFSGIDRILDVHADILGMELSPDNAFLFVNVLPWKQDEAISKYAPRTLKCIVIDLVTFKKVGTIELSRSCAFIPTRLLSPSVGKYLVGNSDGARCGGIWDRNYGVRLAHLFHDAPITRVAIDPSLEQIAASVSSDGMLKIWLSRQLASGTSSRA